MCVFDGVDGEVLKLIGFCNLLNVLQTETKYESIKKFTHKMVSREPSLQQKKNQPTKCVFL